MPPKYATGTKVPVINSRAEITGILVKHGVVRQAWSNDPLGDTLMFSLHEHVYKFWIPKPSEKELQDADPNAYANVNGAQRVEKGWMRRWRAQVLPLKAKLDFPSDESSSAERELLPYLV